MYQRYADDQSWKITHLSESAAENGGLKEAIVQVNLQIMFLLLLASSRFPVLGAQQAGMQACRTSAALLLRIMGMACAQAFLQPALCTLVNCR